MIVPSDEKHSSLQVLTPYFKERSGVVFGTMDLCKRAAELGMMRSSCEVYS
jgi:hypothetical protein